jgi:ParB/RepB/Spo0J family partition protein
MTTATVDDVQESAVDEMLNVEGDASIAERDATEYEIFWQAYPGQILTIAASDITVRAEDNGRYQTAMMGDKSLKSLVASIETEGQMQPVGVRLIDGLPVLGFGFRRFAAINTVNAGRKESEKLGVKCVPMNEDGQVDDLDAFTRNAAENMQREELSAIDKLKIFERFAAAKEDGGFGLTQKEIAERCGCARPLVSMYLNHLSHLSDKSKGYIHAGKVGAFVAVELGQSKEYTPAQIDAELDRIVNTAAQTGKTQSVRGTKAKTREKQEAKGKSGKARTLREMVTDLNAEYEEDTNSDFKTARLAVLGYVTGKVSFDTMMKKIAG